MPSTTHAGALRSAVVLVVVACVVTVAPRTAAAGTSAEEAYVTNLISEWRTPSAAEVRTAVAALHAGGSRLTFTRALVHDPDWYVSSAVDALYSLFLGRAPDAGGGRFWSDALASGRVGPFEAIARFAGSPEYERFAPDDASFLRDLDYLDLGRGITQNDIDAWTRRINSVGRAPVARAIARSREGIRYRVDGWFDEALDRDPSADDLAFWSPYLRSHGDLDLHGQLLASSEAFGLWSTAPLHGPGHVLPFPFNNFDGSIGLASPGTPGSG